MHSLTLHFHFLLGGFNVELFDLPPHRCLISIYAPPQEVKEGRGEVYQGIDEERDLSTDLQYIVVVIFDSCDENEL